MKTFPMFLKMTDRRVVIAGGGEQAAQKARLILKTEATITLLAPELDDELADLVATGRAIQDRQAVTPESYAGAALVFVATGCPGADTALQALAKEAGALVNVVDQPALCDAYTPSIVDRDPLVVAIGTEGNAPVLGRLLKSQIEETLEPRLGDLVRLAGRLRDSVARHVPAAKRRGFWRWMFTDQPRALHARGSDHAAARLLKEAIAEGAAPSERANGTLSVVGAGPGPADLLTMRAVQRLQEADIIFLSEDIAPELLEFARRDAERVRYRCASRGVGWTAEALAGRLAAEARRGRAVVHLVPDIPEGGPFPGLSDLEQEGVLLETVAGVPATDPTGSGHQAQRQISALS